MFSVLFTDIDLCLSFRLARKGTTWHWCGDNVEVLGVEERSGHCGSIAPPLKKCFERRMSFSDKSKQPSAKWKSMKHAASELQRS